MTIPNLTFSEEELAHAVTNGLVTQRKHPDYPLYIYNYTPKAAYDRIWNEVTMTCRGLVLDENYHIVGKPFRKFWNYGEPESLSPEAKPLMVRMQATSKCDGSLGLILSYRGNTFVATRGSFESDQAIWATNFLKRTYSEFVVPEGLTPLVEIIYQANRIVVSYGYEDLVLLAVIDNETGADLPLGSIDWPGPITQIHNLTSAKDAHDLAMSSEFDDQEGLVLCWPIPNQPSFRLKCKNGNYVLLHKILTGLSEKRIWEAVKEGKGFDELIGIAPGEIFEWINSVKARLLSEFQEISDHCHVDLARVELGSRKETAEYFKTCKHPGILFAMLDDKQWQSKIWNMIKPVGNKTYKVDIDA
ncbi:MAG: RNA ligase [Saprospiraceae bacterium]